MSICVHTVCAASDPNPTNPPTVPPQTLDRHLCTFERQFHAPVVAEPGACWTVEPNANAPGSGLPDPTAAAAAAAVSTTPPYATVAGVAAEVQSIKVCVRAPLALAVDHDHDASLGMQSMS